MELKAFQKANDRLRVALKQAAELKICQTYDDFRDAWFIFLRAAKGVYTTLEQGAKATPQARQWFGAKNQERKKDALLRYVTEARNDDEHGIESVTDYVPGSFTLGIPSGGFSKDIGDEHGNRYQNVSLGAMRFENQGPDFIPPKLVSLDGKPIRSEVVLPHVILAPVRDRTGKTYPPPQTHLGSNITPDPIVVADLMVKYLQGLIVEAKDYCTP